VNNDIAIDSTRSFVNELPCNARLKEKNHALVALQPLEPRGIGIEQKENKP
jgi:hypothetical protein